LIENSGLAKLLKSLFYELIIVIDCIFMREINLVGILLLGEIIIGTKASCDKKCIKNERNKAVGKKKPE